MTGEIRVKNGPTVVWVGQYIWRDGRLYNDPSVPSGGSAKLSEAGIGWPDINKSLREGYFKLVMDQRATMAEGL